MEEMGSIRNWRRRKDDRHRSQELYHQEGASAGEERIERDRRRLARQSLRSGNNTGEGHMRARDNNVHRAWQKHDEGVPQRSDIRSGVCPQGSGRKANGDGVDSGGGVNIVKEMEAGTSRLKIGNNRDEKICRAADLSGEEAREQRRHPCSRRNGGKSKKNKGED